MAAEIVRVDYGDLLLAFELVSAGNGYGDLAYVSLETGEIFVVSRSAGIAEGPEDIEESDEYLVIPGKRGLDLGLKLVMSFVGRELPEDWENVSEIFRRKGAYGRFKQLLHDRGKLDAWYAFENNATEQALREWCEDNGFSVNEK